MKIQKFNESYRGDKVIKLYNGSIIHDYYQHKDEYERYIKDTNQKLLEEKNEIINLINEYVRMNWIYFKKKYYIHHNIENFIYYIDEDTKTPRLALDTKYSDRVWLIYQDIEGLLNYINNPDLYRDTKKYNL